MQLLSRLKMFNENGRKQGEIDSSNVGKSEYTSLSNLQIKLKNISKDVEN